MAATARTLGVTRVLGALAAVAGMVAFACHLAVPVELADGSTITLVELTATYDDVGLVLHMLLLATIGTAVAIRPAIGARVLALGGLGLPWAAVPAARLWDDAVPGAARVQAAAIVLGLVVVALAVVLGIREVRWSAGGVLLGDGLAVVALGAVLGGLLAINWYRLQAAGTDLVFDDRFGAELDTGTTAGRLGWLALALAVVAVGVAAASGGWSRRVAGWVALGTCAFEAVRRVFLSGDRLFSPAEQSNEFGVRLSGEPVLGLLVIPIVGAIAGAWFLTTEGEASPAPTDDDQRLAARNPSDSADASSA